MAETKDVPIRKTPWHLWLVGIVALLWQIMGVYDYLMTETRNAAYMARFTPEQLEYFYGFPAWVVAFWAVAVWGGLVAAVLLLMRRRLAVPAFLASLVAMVITSIYNFGMSNGAEVMGAGGVIFSVAIFVLAIFFWLYARAMQNRGVLS